MSNHEHESQIQNPTTEACPKRHDVGEHHDSLRASGLHRAQSVKKTGYVLRGVERSAGGLARSSVCNGHEGHWRGLRNSSLVHTDLPRFPVCRAAQARASTRSAGPNASRPYQAGCGQLQETSHRCRQSDRRGGLRRMSTSGCMSWSLPRNRSGRECATSARKRASSSSELFTSRATSALW
jgi:hypothetical protein